MDLGGIEASPYKGGEHTGERKRTEGGAAIIISTPEVYLSAFYNRDIDVTHITSRTLCGDLQITRRLHLMDVKLVDSTMESIVTYNGSPHRCRVLPGGVLVFSQCRRLLP